MELRKKRVLIIGSNGKLGAGLARCFSGHNSYELLCAGASEKSSVPGVEYRQIDITKRNNIKTLFHDFFPDMVINAAGFTNVDLCETQKELSWNVNVKGTEGLAASSWAIDAHIIHISSDYIFDGKEGPYTEEDIPHPISYYGRTKLAAENAIRTSGARHTIIRTNVLYGSSIYGRPDFASWVIENLSGKKEIRVVTDQHNNPTLVSDLVKVIETITELEKEGIYNIGGPKYLSRYEFAVKLAEYFGLISGLIQPVTTADLKQPAARPLKSGLICTKAEEELGYKPLRFEEAFKSLKTD